MAIRRPGLFRSTDARATLQAVQQYVQSLLAGALPPHYDPEVDFDLVDEINGELAKKADLGNDGKILLSQVPTGALERFAGTAVSQAAMLALQGEVGDYCLRTDTNGGLGSIWFLVGSDPTQLASWLESPVGISQAAADVRYRSIEIAFQIAGRPAASDEFRYVSGSPKSVYATGSIPGGRLHIARIKTAPTANAVFNIHRALSASPQTLGSSLGTVTFAAGDRTGSVMIVGAFTLAVGDSLVLVAPSIQDATLADGAISLWAVETT
ncbi:MAG: hypothetical protein SF070_18115 [Gemmatimonadota bacterium]|nr:hypothetical protein [Gemmatimonadota bacterium]